MITYNNENFDKIYYGSEKIKEAYLGSQLVHKNFVYFKFDNGEEPTGEKNYFTPLGAGLRDGTSWSNAYGFDQIHVALLERPNNHCYFSEGEYIMGRELELSSDVHFYGGFNGDMTWATRNSFEHETLLRFVDDGYSACVGFLDGFTILTLNVSYCKNVIFSSPETSTPRRGSADNAENSIIYATKGVDNLTHCIILGGNDYTNAIDCMFINCSSLSSNDYYRIVWDSINCIFINCRGNIFYAKNSIFHNCGAYNCYLTTEATHCTFIRNAAISYLGSSSGYLANEAKNCIFRNNIRYIYETMDLLQVASDQSGYNGFAQEGNAQDIYDHSNAVTIDQNNAISKFVDLGTISAIGLQSITYPDPLTQPFAFNAFIAQYGDYHLQPTSLLKGQGVYDADVTTDKDGVSRPNPPTIGAYEPNTI